MKNKVLVLLSGGIDSTICLALAIQKYGNENVSALIVNYGQNNVKEITHAKMICDYYKVHFEVIHLENIFKYSSSSMIKTSNNKIPHESYAKQYLKLGPNDEVSTNVPFRNGVMFSICASYALNKKINKIYNGIHKERGIAYKLYPDCSSEFNTYMALAIYHGTNKKVELESPLVNMEKKEIIKLGIELNVPFELTWTCYEDNELPCGKCTACTDRIKGFKDNKMEDPLKYEAKK